MCRYKVCFLPVLLCLLLIYDRETAQAFILKIESSHDMGNRCVDDTFNEQSIETHLLCLRNDFISKLGCLAGFDSMQEASNQEENMHKHVRDTWSLLLRRTVTAHKTNITVKVQMEVKESLSSK